VEQDFQKPKPMMERPKKAVVRTKKPRPVIQAPAVESAPTAAVTSEGASPGSAVATTAALGTGTAAAELSTPQMGAMFIKQIKPVYPSEAKRLKQEGKVILSIFIGVSGKIDKVEITESSGFPLLDDAALAAARRSQLRPAFVANRPVPSKIEAPYRFVLKDR
jgi:protein TonB